jgi:hypothetical protein
MFVPHDLLIFADAGWLKLVFVVVFFLIWLFNNLVGDQAKARKAKAAGRPAQPQPPQIPDGDRPPEQQQLAGEIEEFLKRASQKRQDRSKRKQSAKVAKPTPPPVKKPTRRLVSTQDNEPQTQTQAAFTVADSVRQHLDTSDFIVRASGLADEDIAKDDAERAAHMKEVFGHQVGRLADTSGPKAAAAQPMAPAGAAITPLAALLANPQSLKQAIVLQEILNRREF